MTERGIAHACSICREGKRKCSGKTPCDRCVRMGMADICTPAEDRRKSRRAVKRDHEEMVQGDRFHALVSLLLESGVSVIAAKPRVFMSALGVDLGQNFIGVTVTPGTVNSFSSFYANVGSAVIVTASFDDTFIRSDAGHRMVGKNFKDIVAGICGAPSPRCEPPANSLIPFDGPVRRLGKTFVKTFFIEGLPFTWSTTATFCFDANGYLSIVFYTLQHLTDAYADSECQDPSTALIKLENEGSQSPGTSEGTDPFDILGVPESATLWDPLLG